MVLTVSFVLFPVTMLGCHRHPQGARCALREFSACIGAPEPHDFAVRLSHVRPTCPPRPPHPRPTVRDDRPKRPSSSRRDAREHGFDLPDGASLGACGRLARRAVCAWGVCIKDWIDADAKACDFGRQALPDISAVFTLGPKQSSEAPTQIEACTTSNNT
jgi:hypothetical protein